MERSIPASSLQGPGQQYLDTEYKYIPMADAKPVAAVKVMLCFGLAEFMDC